MTDYHSTNGQGSLQDPGDGEGQKLMYQCPWAAGELTWTDRLKDNKENIVTTPQSVLC